jgi:hypothetical protein
MLYHVSPESHSDIAAKPMDLLDQLKPPTESGQVIVMPDAESLPDLARSNAALRSEYRFAVMDVHADELVRMARTELLDRAGEYTSGLSMLLPSGDGTDLLIATGHQPVLPHPGVWLKNHLAWQIAQAAGGLSVNFIVDNDVVDLSRVAVPVRQGDELGVATVRLADDPDGVAAEEMTAGRGSLAAMVEQARAAVGDSLCEEFGGAMRADGALADFITHPRRKLEESLFGVRNLELPVGRLAETEAFRIFAAHLSANAGRFREIYNRALCDYRERFNVRNPVEPTPDLRDGELPLWTWEPGGRRRPATGIEGPGRKIRPRALAMTMFFRLFCCDLFIHGMGGARYEPVNDVIIREFFGVEPPPYVAASATLRVDLNGPLPVPEDAEALRQTIRRMKATPERFTAELMPGDAEANELAQRRLALLNANGLSKRERRDAYDEGKKIAARLRELMGPHILAAQKRLEQAEEVSRLRAALQDRTFPFFLHSRAALEALYRQEGPMP